MRRCVFEAEGLGVHRVLDKLRLAGIPVLSAQKTQKNAVRIAVNGKDRKKVFAILRGSCYNVKNVRARGLERLAAAGMRTAGLFVGGAVALACVLAAQTRVLRIEVVGSGAYYDAEVLDILARGGVELFSPVPSDTGALAAEVLSLPRVEFCSVRTEGGVCTVTVEVSGAETAPEEGPLVCPVSGVLEELTVIRGTPRFAAGDAVSAGDVLVDNVVFYGETARETLVIAGATVRSEVSAEYPLGEEGARMRAYLDYGELTDIHTEKTEEGCTVRGIARRRVARNFG